MKEMAATIAALQASLAEKERALAEGDSKTRIEEQAGIYCPPSWAVVALDASRGIQAFLCCTVPLLLKRERLLTIFICSGRLLEEGWKGLKESMPNCNGLSRVTIGSCMLLEEFAVSVISP